MADASRDSNNVPTLIAVLNTDGSTIVRVKVDATTHGLKINDNNTGSDNGPTNALRDGNFVPTLLAVSSSDGKTPVVVYSDSSGNLLVQSS